MMTDQPTGLSPVKPRCPYRARARAHGKISAAISRGEMTPAKLHTCVDCGRPAEHWEHRNYFAPYDVEAVCHKCNYARGEGFPPLKGYDDKEFKRLQAEADQLDYERMKRRTMELRQNLRGN